MPQTFNDQIEQLRQQFLAGLPQRAHQIEALWQRYINADHHAAQALKKNEDLNTLHILIHRLVGSGASFGLPEISSTAQILDTYLQDYLQEYTQSHLPLDAIQYEMLDKMVTTLAHMLNSIESIPASATPVAFNKTGLGKRIFVVDNDRALSTLIATYLQTSGFNVQQFDTPSACIRQLPLQTPHIILMGVNFQDDLLQGFEAVEHIKNELGNSVPIILLSARTDMNARLRALRAGCTNYLTKPIDFIKLANTISMTLNHYESTYKVMIVDDEELVAEYHAQMLRHAGMDVICVSEPLQSLQRAIDFKPDLVVLDMHMPDVNGIELATLLRQEEQFLVLPIVFVTGDRSQSLRSSLESLGVNAILNKPVTVDELIHTCERAITDTLALKNRMARVIQRAGYRQQITRSYFFSAIDLELQQLHQKAADIHAHLPAALYYLGLDDIENLYEQYGQAGIATLHEQFCKMLANVMNTDEQWADISNLVVCVLTGSHSHKQHQERVTQIIAHLHSFMYELLNEKLSLGASAGITYLNTDIESANSALLHAEQAYDKARSQGGSRESEYISNHHIAGLNINIKQSLPADNLSISYQPMISLEQQHIDHYEVVVRWRTETDDLIPASKFLHYIEHSSMRRELDHWLVENTVSAMVDENNSRESAKVFIQLSIETLQQTFFFSFVETVLHNSTLNNNHQLIFIIEEPWINSHLQKASVIFNAIRNSKCGICLALAGSTSDSEKIFNKFQFDYIRLAPRLITRLEPDHKAIPELQKIIALAKSTGAQIIATQVEDSKNLSTLWLQGVRLFQGFFIQTPEQYFHTKNDVNFARKFLKSHSQ